MKKVIVFLVLAIILLSIVIVYKTTERISNISNKEKLEENVKDSTENNESQELPQLKHKILESDNEDGGASEEAGDKIENETKIENKTLPSDTQTKPCGFYFGEYAVCVGTCPSGSCVQEGRSCYCKGV